MDIIRTTLLGLLTMLCFILHPIYEYAATGKWTDGATDLAAEIRKKEPFLESWANSDDNGLQHTTSRTTYGNKKENSDTGGLLITCLPNSNEIFKAGLNFNSNKIGKKERLPFLNYTKMGSINKKPEPISSGSVILRISEKIYVALSRVKTVAKYILGKLKIARSKKSSDSLKIETERLNKEKIPNFSHFNFSLNTILNKLLCNAWYYQSDIKIFLETQTLFTGDINNEDKQLLRCIMYLLFIFFMYLCNKYHKNVIQNNAQQHVDLVCIQNNAQQHVDLVCIEFFSITIISGYKPPSTSIILFRSSLEYLINKTETDTIKSPDHTGKFEDLLHTQKLNSIRNNLLPNKSWLNDITLDAFLKVLKKNKPMFDPLSVLLVQRLQDVEAVRENQVDIQIFGGTSDFQHWHCLYYDGNTLHIYDSIQYTCFLTPLEKEYIKKRYPSVKESGILFEKCQPQPDNDSCGVFAAANATSLAFGHNPSDRRYQLDSDNRTTGMRKHLFDIIKNELLLDFP